MLELNHYSVRDSDALVWMCLPERGPKERIVLSDAAVHSPADLGSAERRLRGPGYDNGGLQTARLRRHVTFSPFGSPSCGVSGRSPLGSVLPDSWDEMCKSKTGNLLWTV